MPTGYTAAVQNGEITELKDFAIHCARAMGALISMRDEPSKAPIPERFEAAPYYAERVTETEAELNRLLNLSPHEIELESLDDFEERYARWKERSEERNLYRQRYEAMLDKVYNWSTEAEGIQNFMIQQLNDSLKFDCDGFYDRKPKMEDANVWFSKQVENARKELSYALKARAEEEERIADRNRWIDALRESLKNT